MSTDATGRAGGAPPRPRPVVAASGRGELCLASLHRRPLLQHAVAALVEACGRPVTVLADHADTRRVRDALGSAARDVRLTTPEAWWDMLAASPEQPVLLHDPLCPLVTGDFLEEVLAAGGDGSVVAFRPVTDTVKRVSGREIVGTVDREQLATVSSPLLLGVRALAAMRRTGERPPWRDATALAARLHQVDDVTMLRAPSLGRRVDDLASLQVLECLDEVRRRTRTG